VTGVNQQGPFPDAFCGHFWSAALARRFFSLLFVFICRLGGHNQKQKRRENAALQIAVKMASQIQKETSRQFSCKLLLNNMLRKLIFWCVPAWHVSCSMILAAANPR
jgi:hypothetical protein